MYSASSSYFHACGRVPAPAGARATQEASRATASRLRLPDVSPPEQAGGALDAHGRSGQRQPFGRPSERRRAAGCRPVTRRAKFQQFEGATSADDAAGAAAPADAGADDESREDAVMPDSLEEALRQASRAAANYVNSGGTRCTVELLLPEISDLAEEGAQQRVWDCARFFLEWFREHVGNQNVKAVFPDAGVAALLKHQWQDAPFAIASLSDRRPIGEDDEIVALISPDYQYSAQVQQLANSLVSEDSVIRPMVLWNPRLSSGDVGIGYNVRRMREFFLTSFIPVYYLRPLRMGGAVYRCYPEPWLLFRDDPDLPGRYLLVKQQGSRPDADDIESLLMEAPGEGGEEGPSALDRAVGAFSSLQRFMKSLSK